nr:gem-associated protein 5 [Onthophagus taurus]
MNNLVIPPSPNWYESKVLTCAVDGTLVYGAQNEIIIINPTEQDKAADVKTFPRAHYARVLSVDVNSNWGLGNKLVVSASEDKIIHLWNAETYLLHSTNSTHTTQEDKLIGSVFLGIDKIVSISENGFISLWRFKSGETITFKNIFGFKSRITTLTACPHLSWMMAFGLSCGLVVIADLRKTGRVIYKLRGHDKSIVSLSWCPTPFNIFPKKVIKTASVKIERKVEEEAHQDLSTDNVETTNDNQALLETETEENGEIKKEIEIKTECIEVKTEMDESNTIEKEGDAICEIGDLKKEIDEDNKQIEIEVNSIQVNSSLDTNIKIESQTALSKDYLLASSARDGSICIWRAGTDGRKQMELSGRVSKAKNWRNAAKSWVSLCWITPEILLSSSITAELLQWNLLKQTNRGPEKKLVHHDHSSNLFVIAAPIILIPEWKNENKSQCLFAWTIGQERYLLNTSLQADRTIVASLPTLGGHIYSLKSSLLDPSRLAIGIGDNTARIWDLSRPHKQCVTMANLWQKIQGRVLALAWHPTEENILAYGTAEGRVGTINTCSKKTNLLCQYFRNAVYDMEWGPIDSNINNLGLYAVGEGKLVVYNTSKENEDPKLVDSSTKEQIQCLTWKSDFTILSCGTKTGSILIYNTSLTHLTTIYSDYKSIYGISWHPLATAEDEGMSPMSSWLAISSSSTSVVVFDIKSDQGEGDKNKDIQKIVLNRHTKPVRCIAWSPYVGGRLVSGGDDGVIHVWDVKNKLVLATCIEHLAEAIFTVLWSPLDENFIISGGRDNFIRIWNVNEQKPKTDEEIKKSLETYLSFRMDKKRLTKDQNDDDKDIKVQRGVMLNLASKAQNTPEKAMNDCVRLFKKLNPDEVVNIEEKESLRNDFDVLKLFDDKDNMLHILNEECKNHKDKKKYQQSQHIDLWKGDITESLTKAISGGNVTPWLINLAPMVSIDLWKQACEAYAKKLVEDAKSDPIETASYLLMCHKVEEAIEVLCTATLYREALAIAKCRLSKNDPIIEEILKKWATYGVISGAYEVSTQCFIVLGQYEEAAKVLFKRSDIDSLKFAVVLAEKSGNKDLINACITRFNMFNNVNETENEQRKEIKNEMVEIKDEMINSEDEINQVKDKPIEIKNEMIQIKNESVEIDDDIKVEKQDKIEIKNEMVEIKNEMIQIKSESVEIEGVKVEKEDNIEIKNDIDKLKNDEVEIKDDHVEINDENVIIKHETIDAKDGENVLQVKDNTKGDE